MIKHDIGFTLKYLRKNYGISQKDLCEKIHLSQSTISRFENNSQSPVIEELIMYLNGIEVSLSDYFTKAIELSNTNMQLTSAIQKILLHYHDYKNSKLYLIQEELLLFKTIYDDMTDEFFNVYLETDRYIQLHTIYPNYFKPINIDLINKKAERLLNQRLWLLQDINFLLVTIHYLIPNNILILLERIIHADYKTFNQFERRSFETILENLSDNFLNNRKKYEKMNIPVKKLLNRLFDFWDNYSSKYSNTENILIRQHNHTIFQLCYGKNKKTFLDEGFNRCRIMKTLGLDYLSDLMMQELKAYQHGIKNDVQYFITN